MSKFSMANEVAVQLAICPDVVDGTLSEHATSSISSRDYCIGRMPVSTKGCVAFAYIGVVSQAAAMLVYFVRV
jgi:hypothetical protein